MIKSKKGFTIIELLLSMFFVSMLIVLIGYVTMQIINNYQKGIAIKDVNKTADAIIGDIQRTVFNGAGIKCGVKKGSTWSYGDNCQDLYNESDRPVAAMICTGKFAYVWNYGWALKDTVQEPHLIKYAKDAKSVPVRMLKITDEKYCLGNSGELDNALKKVDNIKTEMIEYNDRELALHSFAITNTIHDASTGQSLYNIEFVLGTFRNNVLKTEDAQCKSPREAADDKDDVKDLKYCAINKFDFVVRGLQGKGTW